MRSHPSGPQDPHRRPEQGGGERSPQQAHQPPPDGPPARPGPPPGRQPFVVPPPPNAMGDPRQHPQHDPWQGTPPGGARPPHPQGARPDSGPQRPPAGGPPPGQGFQQPYAAPPPGARQGPPPGQGGGHGGPPPRTPAGLPKREPKAEPPNPADRAGPPPVHTQPAVFAPDTRESGSGEQWSAFGQPPRRRPDDGRGSGPVPWSVSRPDDETANLAAVPADRDPRATRLDGLGPARPGGADATRVGGLPPVDDYDDREPRRDPRRRTNAVLIGAIVVVALVLVVGIGGYFLGMRPGGDPAAPGGEQAGPVDITSESTDTAPLDPATAFAAPTLETAQGETFTQVTAAASDDCATAARNGFAEVLSANDCRQVARASYVDAEQQFAVTTGIAAFADAESARAAYESADFAAGEWFTGLQGDEGSGADRLHYSGAQVAGEVWGRYVTFTVASYSNGRFPPQEDEDLVRLSQEFVAPASAEVVRRAGG
ncbi:hypothetical protein [Allonocardiopsis opalescens]|uniref:Uncharacterized protein n=1 Tax=Allonocardiopsis opalescens TaxID=1144618 RepID=A0A2T0Q828_9ACTN|nr:hypothetical protein [Allonocardiopsis opalescens]PRY00011.1 hypothetical protein CLV72_103621 [Allonocardiopsis opalescens]